MAQGKIIMDEETKKLLSNSEIMPREIEVKGKILPQTIYLF